MFFPKLKLLLGTDEKRFRREGEDLKEDKDGALLLALVFDENDMEVFFVKSYSKRDLRLFARGLTHHSLLPNKCYR